MERTQLLALDRQYVWHPYTPMEEHIREGDPLVVHSAEGPFLNDINGRQYIDACGSWWVCSLGHRHPRLVQALREQLETLAHCAFGDSIHAPAVQLAQALVERAPGAHNEQLPSQQRLERVFFVDNGSTAVEVALKMAVQFHRQNGASERCVFVTFDSAFHGETIGSTSVGGLASIRAIFEPVLFRVVHLPRPDDPARAQLALEQLESLLDAQGHTIAGVILEPLIQGVAGMRVHTPAFVREVRALTHKHNTLLIADEVFTGLGRTGEWFACDHAQVVPDILCLAKSLSGGLLPFGATLATRHVFEGFLGDRSRALLYGHSYCGNPLGARVALEVMRVMHDEAVLDHARSNAQRIANGIATIAQRNRAIVSHRAFGVMGALDLGKGGYLANEGWIVHRALRERGVWLRPLGDTVYITPPLNTPFAVIDTLLSALEDGLREATLTSQGSHSG